MQQTSIHLRFYFSLVYLLVFGMIALFWPFADADTAGLNLYMVTASASYAVLYLLPAVVITALLIWLLKLFGKSGQRYRRLIGAVAWLCSSVVVLLVYADYQIYSLYEYHFNGFVWNLITTPGGIEALGATTSTKITIALQVVGFMLLTAGLFWLSNRLAQKKAWVSKRQFVAFVSMMLLVLAVDETVYAYSIYTGQEAYIQASTVIPFHLKSSADNFFKTVGIKRTGVTKLRIAHGQVNYPLEKIETKALKQYPNIIMLVAESFRSDLLDPKITPNLWAFSQQSLNFTQHYSGGNRTRMGLLSMFYGLYAPYWYGFQEQKVSPVLMDVLQDKGYQFALHTSQSFDYPELRDTVFHGMNEANMQELQQGEPWQRDHQNISDIITKLDYRDKNKPFYDFMFFESTHAPYSFPQQAVIKPDYIKELNYAQLDLMNNIDQIHNRYINAAHHIDAEVGRLLDYLKKQGMLDNTIVLFTGDHGEEFMEHGHWGHGHNQMFPEQQVHVPLVLWMPGTKPKQITQRTSHIQIPQTLLAQLGVTTPADEYSLAGDLFTPLPFVVAGNYNYLSVMDDHYKITFPFTSSDYFHYTVFDRQDNSVSRDEKKTAIARMQPEIDQVVAQSQRFVSKTR